MIGQKVISQSGLTAELPHFLRVDDVSLYYRRFYGPPIAEQCQAVVNNLQPFKKALIDSNVVNFIGQISQDHNCFFSDHLQLLNHIRKELLPIFASSRCYNFCICSYNDYNLASNVSFGANVISSIIQMDSIDSCSKIEIRIYGRGRYPMQLPIEPISKWLTRKRNVIRKHSKERFLRIFIFNFQNAQQLCDHLIKVIKIFKLIFCNY